MKPLLQILVLIVLALVSAGIVFVVNAPKWFDGQVPTATQATR